MSLSAGQRYAEARGQKIEEARRELTELLIDARHMDDGPPAHYRARSRATGLDITARILPDGRLLVVVSVNVRSHG